MTVFPAMPFLPQLFLTPEAFQRSERNVTSLRCVRSILGRAHKPDSLWRSKRLRIFATTGESAAAPSQWRRPARMRALNSRHRCLFNLTIEAAGLV